MVAEYRLHKRPSATARWSQSECPIINEVTILCPGICKWSEITGDFKITWINGRKIVKNIPPSYTKLNHCWVVNTKIVTKLKVLTLFNYSQTLELRPPQNKDHVFLDCCSGLRNFFSLKPTRVRPTQVGKHPATVLETFGCWPRFWVYLNLICLTLT